MLSLQAQLIELLGEESHRRTVHEVACKLAPGEVAAARAGTMDVAVGRLCDGRLTVIPDRCPHDGGPISDGFLDGDRLVCARHGWEIDPCTGRCPRRSGADG